MRKLKFIQTSCIYIIIRPPKGIRTSPQLASQSRRFSVSTSRLARALGDVGDDFSDARALFCLPESFQTFPPLYYFFSLHHIYLFPRRSCANNLFSLSLPASPSISNKSNLFVRLEGGGRPGGEGGTRERACLSASIFS